MFGSEASDAEPSGVTRLSGSVDDLQNLALT